MRNAFCVPEYLYEFVLLLLCTLHCTCSFCFDQLLQKHLPTFTCIGIRYSILSCPAVSSCESQCVIWWHLRHVCYYLPKHLQHWHTLSTVKDHLCHSLANKFWHWLTQTNLRLLAFRLGPLILSRIGVRIYKTYSVWQFLLQLRKAKLNSEQQRFTVWWPEGVWKSLHVEWVSLSFSGQL